MNKIPFTGSHDEIMGLHCFSFWFPLPIPSDIIKLANLTFTLELSVRLVLFYFFNLESGLKKCFKVNSIEMQHLHKNMQILSCTVQRNFHKLDTPV